MTTAIALEPEELFHKGKWSVRDLALTLDKARDLWEKYNEHRTLFTDLSKGNLENWVRFITDPDSFWLELVDTETGETVGLMYFRGMEQIVDIEMHAVTFDRKPAEKLELVREIIRWMFANFPINRITAPTASIYFSTKRLLERAGLTHEGVRREALLIGGKWVDRVWYGITRSEVEKNYGR